MPARANLKQLQTNHHRVMKRVITSILIAVILYFLLPLVARFIPHHHLLVVAITAGIVALGVISVMEKV